MGRVRNARLTLCSSPGMTRSVPRGFPRFCVSVSQRAAVGNARALARACAISTSEVFGGILRPQTCDRTARSCRVQKAFGRNASLRSALGRKKKKRLSQRSTRTHMHGAIRKNSPPCGTRARNLRIRSPTPCPLGQGGSIEGEATKQMNFYLCPRDFP